MRILVAHDVPAQHVGGMNRLMRFTHDPLVERGHQVDYFTAENVATGNHLRRRFEFPRAVYKAAVEAFRTGRGYDIINVHEAQSAWISLLKHRAGNPYVVVTAHGSAPALKTGIVKPLTRLWQMRVGIRRADLVFCLSEEDRSYFASRMQIAPEKLTRFYSGANSSQDVLAAYERLIAADRQWLHTRRTPAEPKTLRYCFVANFKPDWNAGAAGSILAIGRELEAAGHSVRYRWKQSRRSSSLTNLFLLPWTQYRQVKEECVASRPDVVIVSQPFAFPVFERLQRKFPQTVFLNLTHGWEHRHDIAESVFGWRSNLRGANGLKHRMAIAARAFICRRTALAADGLLAPCALDGHFLLRQYGVSQDKLLLMTYGLDPSFSVDLPPRSAHAGLRMLFFGQYVPRKGSQILERLLPRVAAEYHDAEVTFIVPPEQVATVNRAYRSAFGDRLQVLPWMDRKELIRICSEHDVFLFPSMLEGFGKTFLEAMACGLCVVGFEEGGLGTVAENNLKALYCKPGDETGFETLLRDCFADAERVRAIGQRARAKALQLTWTRTAQKLESFCLERLQRKGDTNVWATNGQPGSTTLSSSVSSRGCIASTLDIAGSSSIETPISYAAEVPYSAPLPACTPAVAAIQPVE